MSLLLKLIAVAEQSESDSSVTALRSIIGTVNHENTKLYRQISGPPHATGIFSKLSPQWIQDLIRETENKSQQEDPMEQDITDHAT
ncbi:hypothetical protein N8639_01895 [bacterium]|jgi:hypothetical protein|nr:hypothetical protein [bacterium]